MQSSKKVLVDFEEDAQQDIEDGTDFQSLFQPLSNRQAENEDTLKDCPICMSPWHSSGRHRICSLKCGHLFGKHCIERWVRNKGSCPHCNQSSKKNDIRLLFTSKFAVADVSERDLFVRKYDHERLVRKRLQTENAILKRKLEILSQKIDSRAGQSSCNGYLQLSFSKTLKNSRCIGISPDDSSIFTSNVVADNGRKHGLVQISTSSPEHVLPIPLHFGQIKDLSVHKSNGRVLTAGLDGKLILTSIETSSIALEIDLSENLWSCAWGDPSSHLIYAGTQSGMIHSYDLRNPDTPYSSISTKAPDASSKQRSLPVHSLQYCDNKLFFGSMNHCGLFLNSHDFHPVLRSFKFSGICRGIVYDENTRKGVGSFKNDEENSNIVFSVTENGFESGLILDGNVSQLVLCKTDIGQLGGAAVFSGPDSESNSAWIWDVDKGSILQKLQPHSSPLLSTRVSDTGNLFCTCSGDELKVFRPNADFIRVTD